MYPKTWPQIASCPRRSFISKRHEREIIVSFPRLTSISLRFVPPIFAHILASIRFSYRFHRRDRYSVNLNYIYIIYCLTVNSSPLFRWGMTEQKSWPSVFFFVFCITLSDSRSLYLTKTTGRIISSTFHFFFCFVSFFHLNYCFELFWAVFVSHMFLYNTFLSFWFSCYQEDEFDKGYTWENLGFFFYGCGWVRLPVACEV